MRILAGLVPVFLCSCASAPGLYVEVGAGYKIEPNTSYVLRETCHEVTAPGVGRRSCGGDNPTAHFNAGWEFNDRYRCEYAHFSHFFDGGSDREVHLDELRCYRRWGGR